MEHPDVQKLESKLNNIWDYRDNEKARDELKKEINTDEESPPQIFYCKRCKKDYLPKRIVKVDSKDWNTNQLFRFWRSKHCKTWNVRFITNKVKDPFWIKSPSVIQDRRKNALDLIQPGETGFSMLYGKK